MLFPPPGVKIRRTIETQFLLATPTLIAEHDPQRVVLAVMSDYVVAGSVAFAGSEQGLGTPVSAYGYYPGQVLFWGPEEVWALCTTPTSPPGVNILIQSVFYD